MPGSLASRGSHAAVRTQADNPEPRTCWPRAPVRRLRGGVSPKDARAENYSVAQMALPKDVQEIAASLNRALGVGYTVVKQLPASPDPTEAYARAGVWFSGPLSDGVYLLRVALRHDLGVEVEPDFEQHRSRMLAVLNSERRSLERLLPPNRPRSLGLLDGTG